MIMEFKCLKKCNETCQRILAITTISLIGLLSVAGIVQVFIAIAKY